MTILVVDILASYEMLLTWSFCRDLSGAMQLDWSSATIPIKKGKIKIELEPKLLGNFDHLRETSKNSSAFDNF